MNWIGVGALVVVLAVDIFCIREWIEADKWALSHPPTDLTQLDKGREVLAAFLDQPKVDELAPFMVDYAVSLRRQIPDVAVDLGKAVLGNQRALRQAGFDFEPGANRDESYSRLLALLETKVGGLANAMRARGLERST